MDYEPFGQFVQTGGLVDIEVLRFIYNSGLGTGSYELSGSGQLQVGKIRLDRGVFTHSSGTNTVDGELRVGTDDGSADGTYNLSGTAQLWSGSEIIGMSSGVGLFDQAGGTNTIGEVLRVGGAGTMYRLGGSGRLEAPWVRVSGIGELHQSGGRAEIGFMEVDRKSVV